MHHHLWPLEFSFAFGWVPVSGYDFFMSFKLTSSYVVPDSLEHCLTKLTEAIEPADAIGYRKSAMLGGRPLTGTVDGTQFCVTGNSSGHRPFVAGEIIDEGVHRRIVMWMQPSPWILAVFFLLSNTVVTFAAIRLEVAGLFLFWLVMSGIWILFHLGYCRHIMSIIRATI